MIRLRPRPAVILLGATLALGTLAGCTQASPKAQPSPSPSTPTLTPTPRPSPSPTRSASAAPTPTHTPARLSSKVEFVDIQSAAVGGKHQSFYVFLPPGYDQSSTKRYPVMYMLHGIDGAKQFLDRTRGAFLEADMIRRGDIRPFIQVIPTAPWKTDSEWADGARPNDAWETFIARDVVKTIDARFKTIATSAGRGICGLSQGGYEAINIALHHPGEFGLVEAWSGYMTADQNPAVFGNRQDLIDYNSPLKQIDKVAAAVKSAGMYFWFYIGTNDEGLRDNRSFEAKLKHYAIPHHYFEVSGARHGWVLWNLHVAEAYVIASQHLAQG